MTSTYEVETRKNGYWAVKRITGVAFSIVSSGQENSLEAAIRAGDKVVEEDRAFWARVTTEVQTSGQPLTENEPVWATNERLRENHRARGKV